MEIVFLPIFILIELIAKLIMHLFVAILGFIFNNAFRAEPIDFADQESELKPPNPWTVFFSSLAAALILGCAVGGLFFWFWGTPTAFWWGFGVMVFLGIFASINAATGEATPM